MYAEPNVYVGLINFLARSFECVDGRAHEENSHFGVSALNFISNMWCWCHKTETFPSFRLAGSIEKTLSERRLLETFEVDLETPALRTLLGLIELKNF